MAKTKLMSLIERETAVGKAVQQFLGLKFSKKDGLTKTTWGTKTMRGLGASIIRIVEEQKNNK